MLKHELKNSARIALRKGSGLLSVAFLLSFFVNLLRLSGPMFMILIYDRVLTSRSVETLITLFIMVMALMIVLGVLEYARKRIVARFAAQFQERLEISILGTASHNDLFPAGQTKPAIGLGEADALRAFFHSGGLLAVMDFFWVPMFVVVVFILHPTLGYICTAGVGVMFALVLVRKFFIGGREERATKASNQIRDLKHVMIASRDVVRTQEMSPGFKSRWISARKDSRDKAIALKDWTASLEQMSQSLVMIIRYCVLATGAYLTLQGQLTVGAMVACTFLVTRVLAPVNSFCSSIPAIFRAIAGWKSLSQILSKRDASSVDPFGSEAGNPRNCLELSKVSVRSPLTGSLILKSIDLSVTPGSIVEILGSSGQGKSVLAETVLGFWTRSSGTVLCFGTNIGRMRDTELLENFGYVPETPVFIKGTIAENISRIDPDMSAEKVASAARKACLHAWISALPNGYQTMIDGDGSVLSKGQRQQLAFARAVYHNPKVLIIDEADSMLLERLPKTMSRVFEGVIERGGTVIFLARKPLPLKQERIRYNLTNGSLSGGTVVAATPAERAEPVKTKIAVVGGRSAPAKKAVQGPA